MPPHFFAEPEGETFPDTLRFFTRPVFSTYLNRPITEPLSVMEKPLILWPFPSKTPPNEETETNSLSAKLISALSTKVLPTE